MAASELPVRIVAAIEDRAVRLDQVRKVIAANDIDDIGHARQLCQVDGGGCSGSDCATKLAVLVVAAVPDRPVPQEKDRVIETTGDLFDTAERGKRLEVRDGHGAGRLAASQLAVGVVAAVGNRSIFQEKNREIGPRRHLLHVGQTGNHIDIEGRIRSGRCDPSRLSVGVITC